MARSVEIIMIDDMADPPRMLPPIFLPISELRSLLPLKRQDLELHIMKGLAFSPDKGIFEYKQTGAPTDSQRPGADFEDEEEFPRLIRSSLFANDRDYRVVIRMPTIEY